MRSRLLVAALTVGGAALVAVQQPRPRLPTGGLRPPQAQTLVVYKTPT